MAKVGRAYDETKSSVYTLRWPAVALAFAQLVPTPALAQMQQDDVDLGLFLPGDLCGDTTSPLPLSRLSLAPVRQPSNALADLVLAEYTEQPIPASTEPLTEGAGSSLPPAKAGAGDSPTPHAGNPAMAREHAALMALVPLEGATHVAIENGSWFAPATWQSGKVPGADARVLIPSGVTVSYDGMADDPLFSLRVDGALTFATDQDSRMVIDTLVIAPGGRLQIGTAQQPIEPQVKVDILISGAGDIDLEWDPLLLSRGVISHGSVEIHGARKTTFLKTGEPPRRGDTQLVLASVPEGWRVGDTIVVTGTRKRGWAWDNTARAVIHHNSEDEIVTVTALEGNRVTIDRPLLFHHHPPRADLAPYVANVTRTIRFASLGGVETPLFTRGHVMFMHSDAVDVRYAAFDHLGRTDKSRDAFDLSALQEVTPESNIKGRYSLHLHKTGMANREAPAMVVGNSVFGSPGWGYVHHSSHADFIDNVAFDVFGAAFAAEDGDETGIWLRNIAIRATGFDWGAEPAKAGSERHDNGRSGDGFFFAGRLVEAAENVAANTTHGFVWMHRSAPTEPARATLHQPEVTYGRATITPDVPPIQGFRDNEAFGTEIGLLVIKASPVQRHDVWSVLDGFLNWETVRGVDISYSGHYTLKNLDLIATAAQGFFAPDVGVTFGPNSFDIVVNKVRLERFPVGIRIEQGFTFPVPEEEVGIGLIDVEAFDVPEVIRSSSKTRYQLLTADELLQVAVEPVHQPFEIGPQDDLQIWMDKRDSLGQATRQHPGDPQTIYRWELPDVLRSIGYFTDANGRNVALIPDLMSDRATGALFKHSLLVTLNIPESELQSWGAPHRGTYDPDNVPPIAQDDVVETGLGVPVVIKPLGNDSDPDGDLLALEGATDPRHGDLASRDDGSLLYRPNPGHVGPDAFTYWAADGMGNYTPATVRITVVEP